MSLEDKIASLQNKLPKTLAHSLGIELLSALPESIVARMPVDERTKQPFGVLHGGASVALAETLASIGAWLNIDDVEQQAVGIEINANHTRPVSAGWVTGHASPLHLGKSTHVWEVRVENEEKKLVCISRCTLAIISKVSPK